MLLRASIASKTTHSSKAFIEGFSDTNNYQFCHLKRNGIATVFIGPIQTLATNLVNLAYFCFVFISCPKYIDFHRSVSLHEAGTMQNLFQDWKLRQCCFSAAILQTLKLPIGLECSCPRHFHATLQEQCCNHPSFSNFKNILLTL